MRSSLRTTCVGTTFAMLVSGCVGAPKAYWSSPPISRGTVSPVGNYYVMSPLEPDVGYVTYTADATRTDDERERAFPRALQIARTDYGRAWRSGSLRCREHMAHDQSAAFKPTSIVVGLVETTGQPTGVPSYSTVARRIAAASLFDDGIAPEKLPRERVDQSGI